MIFKTVNLVKPQIIALGYDQVHQEQFITEGCKKIKLDAQKLSFSFFSSLNDFHLTTISKLLFERKQVSVVMWLAPRPPVRETRVQIP